MENIVKLSDIFIGKADGMQESKRKDFIDLFYEGNNSYAELERDESKFIISGRKGTGKTILARYYQQKIDKKSGISDVINGNDVLLCHIKEIGNCKIEEKQIAAFTKYVLLIQIANLITDNKRKIVHNTSFFRKRKCIKAINKIKEIVIQRNMQGNFSIVDFCTEEETSGKVSVKNDFCNSGLAERKSVQKNFGKNKYYSLIDTLEEKIAIVAKEIRISLIVDDIDEYRDDTSNNEGFFVFLCKFIEVTSEINELMYNANPENNSKIIILLRSDFVDRLQTKSSNINKTIMDSQIILNWIAQIDEDKPEENVLMDLILTKIRHSNTLLSEMSTRQVYEKFFPDKIGNSRTIKYIFNEGHGRPRDVINLLNVIRRENPTAEAFEPEFFRQAEKEYSRCFKDEIKNEMSIFYSAEKIEDCFRVIILLNKAAFYLDDVNKMLKLYQRQISNIADGEEFIDIMYDAGVIGNYWKEGNKKRYSFKYREDGDEIPDYRAKFVVHTGLRKNLLKL